MQKKLLETMKAFHNICEKKNLKYFIIGGTLLGAVRHKGFIPWDDDVDVCMPRDDFEKFIKIAPEELPDPTKIIDYASQDVLSSAIIKFVNKNTTVIEEGQVNPFGVYIDVFPIDGAGKTKLGAYIHFKRVRLGKFLLSKSAHESGGKFLRFALKVIGNRNIFKNLDSVMKKKSFKKSKYAGLLIGCWGFKEINFSKVYNDRRTFEFEGEEFYGPVCYDEILTRVYGDYMCLPPEEKRKSHHKFKYVNLELPYDEYEKDAMSR